MPAELVAALIAYGLPGILLVLGGWMLSRVIELIGKAIDKKYEIRIGPKE